MHTLPIHSPVLKLNFITLSSKKLATFRLRPKGERTVLTLAESGFLNIPADHRDEAFRRNDGGWTEQMKNIERHVAQTS